MTIRLSPTIAVEATDAGHVLRCEQCGHDLGAAGQPWKPQATLVEVPMREVGNPTYSTAADVVLRRFHCPGCSALLDTESAVVGDPVLNDVLFLDPQT